MVTSVPVSPDVGENEVMVGAAATVTVKSPELVAVCPPTSTVIFPVAALVGTDVVILVAELPVTEAAIPLNLTMLLVVVALKLVPVMVTEVPTEPFVGEKDDILGCS